MESWNAGADDDGVWEAGEAPAAPGGAEPPRDIGALMDRMAAEAEASDEEGEDVKIDEASKMRAPTSGTGSAGPDVGSQRESVYVCVCVCVWGSLRRGS